MARVVTTTAAVVGGAVAAVVRRVVAAVVGGTVLTVVGDTVGVVGAAVVGAAVVGTAVVGAAVAEDRVEVVSLDPIRVGEPSVTSFAHAAVAIVRMATASTYCDILRCCGGLLNAMVAFQTRAHRPIHGRSVTC